MKKVFGKSIATPSWQEAQKLADAKQAKQEAKAEAKAKSSTSKDVKIIKIEASKQDSVSKPFEFKAYLDNGDTAKFDMLELNKFEKIDPKTQTAGAESLSVQLLQVMIDNDDQHPTVSGSECGKILTKCHITETDFVKFLEDHA